MNLWVLFLCRIFVHSKVSMKRVLLAAVIASAGECLILFLPFGVSQIKIILGFGGVTAGIIYYLFCPKSRERFQKLLLAAYLAALLLGGCLELMESIFYWEQESVLGLSTMTMLCGICIKYIYERYKNGLKSDFIEVLLIFSTGESCKVTALVDSGNGLIEPISKKPVSLVEKRVLKPFEKELQPNSFRLVPFHSVGKSKGMIEAYSIEKMEMKKEGECIVIEKPMIGITKEVIAANEKYQMILHPALLELG